MFYRDLLIFIYLRKMFFNINIKYNKNYIFNF